MAEAKKDGLLGVLGDWWNAPARPAEPAEVPPVDPKTLNRRVPAKPMSWTEAVTNTLSEMQKSHYGADYLRDLAKSGYKVGSHFLAHPGEDLSAAWQGFTSAVGSLDQINAAHVHEMTGRWPDSTARRLLPPQAYKKWQDDATRKYRSALSLYSYVDPKTGQRNMDWNALSRSASKDPVGTVAPILTGAGSLAGKAGATIEGLTGLSAAGTVGNAVRRGTRVAAAALDPAGAIASKAVSAAVPPAARAVRIASWRSALDEQGGFTEAARDALRRAGFDPAVYDTPQHRAAIASVLDRKRDMSAPVIREAIASSMNVPVTRSMTLQERAPRGLEGSVAQERDRANAAISNLRTNGSVSTDLNGIVHSFDDVSGQWLDPSGRPVTAPGKIQFLNANRGTGTVTNPTAVQRIEDLSGIVNNTQGASGSAAPGLWDRYGRRFSAPLVGGQVGGYLAGQLGIPPYMGQFAGYGVGSAFDAANEAASALRRERAEFSGAPIDRMTSPDLFSPLLIAQAAAGTGQGPFSASIPVAAPPQPQQQPQPQQKPAPAPVSQDPYALPEGFEEPRSAPAQQARPKAPEDPYALPAGFEESKQDPYALPEGFMRGGRTAYRKGGRVATGIEPLVQNLMNGYKRAKTAEVATTKPLLNHSDQTIVRALRVAKKAI